MPALLKDIREHLGLSLMEMIGQKMHAPTVSVRNGINLTLPILVGGMTGNALDESKAMPLYQALTADHNGSIFDNLSRFFSGHDFDAESGILPHLLGDRQSIVVHMINEKSGLDPEFVMRIMELCAVLLMGYVGRELRRDDLDAEGLTSFLQRATLQISKNAPELYKKLNTLFHLERPPKKKKFSFLRRKKKN